MNNDRLRQITVIVLSVTQLLANALGGAGILFENGVTVGTVSDSYSTFFTPAGFTFAVWGPIYLGLTLYAIYQAWPGQGTRTVHRRIGWLAASAATANTLWTPIFTASGLYESASYRPELVLVSLAIIVWMLVSLAAIFVTLRRMNATLTRTDHALVQVPFYGYFAWVNIATVANATTAMIALGASGTGDGAAIWSVLIIATATAIAAGLILYSRMSAGTLAFLAVLVWAFVGVYAGNSDKSDLVGAAAILAVIVLVGVTAFGFFNDPDAPSAAPAAG